MDWQSDCNTFTGDLVWRRVIAGAFAGWSVAYARLRWVEKNMDRHVFCRGNLIPQGKGKRPSGMVYERKAEQEQKEEA